MVSDVGFAAGDFVGPDHQVRADPAANGALDAGADHNTSFNPTSFAASYDDFPHLDADAEFSLPPDFDFGLPVSSGGQSTALGPLPQVLSDLNAAAQAGSEESLKGDHTAHAEPDEMLAAVLTEQLNGSAEAASLEQIEHRRAAVEDPPRPFSAADSVFHAHMKAKLSEPREPRSA